MLSLGLDLSCDLSKRSTSHASAGSCFNCQVKNAAVGSQPQTMSTIVDSNIAFDIPKNYCAESCHDWKWAQTELWITEVIATAWVWVLQSSTGKAKNCVAGSHFYIPRHLKLRFCHPRRRLHSPSYLCNQDFCILHLVVSGEWWRGKPWVFQIEFGGRRRSQSSN